jgi:hypothetical protein
MYWINFRSFESHTNLGIFKFPIYKIMSCYRSPTLSTILCKNSSLDINPHDKISRPQSCLSIANFFFRNFWKHYKQQKMKLNPKDSFECILRSWVVKKINKNNFNFKLLTSWKKKIKSRFILQQYILLQVDRKQILVSCTFVDYLATSMLNITIILLHVLP